MLPRQPSHPAISAPTISPASFSATSNTLGVSAIKRSMSSARSDVVACPLRASAHNPSTAGTSPGRHDLTAGMAGDPSRERTESRTLGQLGAQLLGFPEAMKLLERLVLYLADAFA